MIFPLDAGAKDLAARLASKMAAAAIQLMEVRRPRTPGQVDAISKKISREALACAVIIAGSKTGTLPNDVLDDACALSVAQIFDAVLGPDPAN